jgi:hypothetical protein
MALLPLKQNVFPALLLLTVPLIFCACADQRNIVFRPDPESPKQTETVVTGELIESQNGPAGKPLPEWVNRFINGGISRVEALGAYRDKYIFIGRNRGTSLKALDEWAARFTIAQDFPRLAAVRIEKRLLGAASLYPDDEYGEFFEAVIKSAFDAEYPEALKGDSFWIKWRVSAGGETAPDLSESANIAGQDQEAGPPEDQDIYEFFVLISINKIMLQTRIQNIMKNTETDVPPSRYQAAAISRIQQNFFEGF